MPGIEFNYPTEAAVLASQPGSLGWAPPNPGAQPQFPVPDDGDLPFQIRSTAADGTQYVEDLGVEEIKFRLNFDRISTVEKNAYYNFWNTVRKSAFTFEYKDFNGINHTVRIISGKKFQEVHQDAWSGFIELRKET